MKRERKPTRCNNQMFIINIVSTCFGHHYAHLQENKTYVTACVVLRWFCWMWMVAAVGRCVVGCEHCEGYCSKHVETVDNKHLIVTSCWFSLSLFTIFSCMYISILYMFRAHTRRSFTQSGINQMSNCYNNSPDDGHMATRNT